MHAQVPEVWSGNLNNHLFILLYEYLEFKETLALECPAALTECLNQQPIWDLKGILIHLNQILPIRDLMKCHVAVVPPVFCHYKPWKASLWHLSVGYFGQSLKQIMIYSCFLAVEKVLDCASIRLYSYQT